MSSWRRRALQLLPEYPEIIETADTPMFLWTELSYPFSRAAEEKNTDLLQRIFDLAQWCWKESRYDEAVTAALIGFYENIPSHKEHWWTIPRFVSSADFNGLDQVFRYFLDEVQFAELAEFYLRERKLLEKDALKTKKKNEQSCPPNSHALGSFVTDPADTGSAPKASGSR